MSLPRQILTHCIILACLSGTSVLAQEIDPLVEPVFETAGDAGTQGDDSWAPPCTPSYPLDVVTEVVLLETQGDECGYYCTSVRRSGAPDRSNWSISREEAELIARIAIEIECTHGIDIAATLAVAEHESGFHRWAVGPGGECGIFQQIPRYARPESAVQSLGCEERGDCSRDATSNVCDWLQDPSNAAESFGLNASRWIERRSTNWPCYYNQGYAGCNPDGVAYRNEHYRVEDRIRNNLEWYLREGDSAE